MSWPENASGHCYCPFSHRDYPILDSGHSILHPFPRLLRYKGVLTYRETPFMSVRGCIRTELCTTFHALKNTVPVTGSGEETLN